MTNMKSVGDKIAANINRNAPGRVALFGFNVYYLQHVSNSHSAPRNKPQNFCQKDHLPTGYPGWKGRLWLWYFTSPKGFGSDGVAGTGIYSGTGGYGHYNFPLVDRDKLKQSGYYPLSWDCIIWADDFPELKEVVSLYDAERATHAIMGRKFNFNYPTEKYMWVNPKTYQDFPSLIIPDDYYVGAMDDLVYD